MSHISRLRGNLFGNYPPRAAINAAREEEEGEGGAAETRERGRGRGGSAERKEDTKRRRRDSRTEQFVGLIEEMR